MYARMPRDVPLITPQPLASDLVAPTAVAKVLPESICRRLRAAGSERHVAGRSFMSLHPAHNPRLQERDREILAHIRRYRLSTPEVLHKLFFDDSERNAVTKVTTRLTELEFLQNHPLFGTNRYFTLGSRGARAMGQKQKIVGPLGPQALYRDFGALGFFCLADPPRNKLTVSEIARNPHLAPLLTGKIDCSHFYLDEAKGVNRLGYLWVEGGGPVEYIVSKVQKKILAPGMSVPILANYIQTGAFVVAIATCTEAKCAQITDALRKVTTPAFFRIVVVPDLIHLLPAGA